MGNLCRKPRLAPPSQLGFTHALRKTQLASILRTDTLTTMVVSFRHAYDHHYDTAPQFARASLVVAGLEDVSDSLTDSEVIVAALIVASRMHIPPPYTQC